MYTYVHVYVYVYIYIYASLDCFRITSCNPAAPSRCPTTEPHNALQHIEGPMSKHECAHAHVVAFLYTHLHTRVQAHALHAHSMRMQRAIPHPQWSLPTGGNEVLSLCVLCNLRVVVYARVCSPPILCMTRHAHACLRAAHVSSHVHDNVNVGDNVSYVCMCVCVRLPLCTIGYWCLLWHASESFVNKDSFFVDESVLARELRSSKRARVRARFCVGPAKCRNMLSRQLAVVQLSPRTRARQRRSSVLPR